VRELGASSSQLQWVVDAYTLVFASFLLLAGSLGDRYGRKTALTIGLVIFGVGSLASALVGSPEGLIATRARALRVIAQLVNEGARNPELAGALCALSSHHAGTRCSR
jgi:MFS family permease